MPIQAPARLFLVVASMVAAIALSTPASAFSAYRSRVPNGTVASCGTCHNNPTLGGEGWNVFGEDVLLQDPDVVEADLATANQNVNYNLTAPEWNADLCDLDSDGDGQTNGQELGDPACSWVFGDPVPRSSDISNPGDPDSTSADPDGVDGGGEEGEGEAAEGEGEGEGDAGGCCAATSASSTPFGIAALGLAFAHRLRRRRRS